MRGKDLTKDKQGLLEFTADEAEKELSGIEGHLIKIDKTTGDDIIVPFCMECVRKHAGYLIKLADECISGQCLSGKIWDDMKKWAEKTRQKVTAMLKNGDMMKESEARTLVAQSRKFRKEMERMALGRNDDHKEILI